MFTYHNLSIYEIPLVYTIPNVKYMIMVEQHDIGGNYCPLTYLNMLVTNNLTSITYANIISDY